MLDSEPNWQRRWPSGLRSTISAIVCAIEDHLLEYLDQETNTESLDYELEQRIKLEVLYSWMGYITADYTLVDVSD